jgi:hypothetical protein
MSDEIKCPKCGRSGIASHGFFSSCLSDDCNWVGLTSSLKSSRVSLSTLALGITSVEERMVLDPIFKTTAVQLIQSGNKQHGLNMDIGELGAHDEGGKIVITQDREKDFTWGSTITFKAKLLNRLGGFMKMSSMDEYFEAITTSELVKSIPELDKRIKMIKIGEDEYVSSEIGSPPIRFKIVFDKTGISKFEWDLHNEDLLWNPIDWGAFNLKKDIHVRYAAVIQVDGENITYFATEDMETGEWRGGVSKRQALSIEPSTISPSTASDIDEAVEKLSAHYNKTYNAMIEDGDPVELSWSNSFDYDKNVMHFCSEVMESDIFLDDSVNTLFNYLGTSRRAQYEEMLRHI